MPLPSNKWRSGVPALHPYFPKGTSCVTLHLSVAGWPRYLGNVDSDGSERVSFYVSPPRVR